MENAGEKRNEKREKTEQERKGTENASEKRNEMQEKTAPKRKSVENGKRW